MPVHFKGMSEYKKHYSWVDSFRSKRFIPSAEQAADPAGRTSVNASVCYEPPMQHKKRLDGPPTSLSANYFSGPSEESEFALLGQRDKFSENVPYQLKNTASPSKIYKNKENFDDPPPPPKQLKMQKRIRPLIKERHPPVVHSPRVQSTSETSPKSPPLAPRQEKLAEPVKEGYRDKDLKDVLEDTTKVEKMAKVAPSRKDVTNNMKESVEIDLKKGQKTLSHEAPSSYALKYKAGVAPPRPLKKMSEYQKQFQWKKGMKASPLLAAEQIVYRSSTDLGPYKTEPIRKLSEYQRQFQPWKPIDVNMDLSLKLDGSHNSGEHEKVDARKRKAKRSKSAGAVLRNENENKQVAEKEEEDLDEAVELKEKLKKTHGKIRRLGTEYRANFKSPTKFKYSQGAWKGANPPQLTPAAGDSEMTSGENQAADDANPFLGNWFAEVLELRRRADEYRKRAQGTHFSREHLVQLMARQAECWDVDSQVSETVRALDLEAPKVIKRQRKDVSGRLSAERYSPRLSEADEEILEEPLEEEKVQRMEKKKRNRDIVPRSRKMAYLEEQREKVAKQQQKLEDDARMEHEDGSVDCDENNDDEGRRPTPLLQQQEKGSVRRHHLDLTTPAVGGALLTCPPSKNSKMIITSRSGDSYVTASDDYEVKQSPKKPNLDKLNTMPILGMPSGDSHALRDEDAEIDKALETHYVPTPLPSCDDDDKENASDKKTGKKSGKNGKSRHTYKPSQLSSVQENHGKTYVKPTNESSVTMDDIKAQVREVDDDMMSVSMMSVASSCSLASEVLERARRRRAEFWGKKD